MPVYLTVLHCRKYSQSSLVFSGNFTVKLNEIAYTNVANAEAAADDAGFEALGETASLYISPSGDLFVFEEDGAGPGMVTHCWCTT